MNRVPDARADVIKLPLLWFLLLLWGFAGCGGDKDGAAQSEQPGASVPAQVSVPQESVVPATVPEPEMEPAQENVPEPTPEPAASEETPKAVPVEPVGKVVHISEPGAEDVGTPEAEGVQIPLDDVHINVDGTKFHQAGGDFSIMVGSFKKASNAADRVAVLQKSGFRAVRETITIDGLKYYRVHLRGIETYDEAESMGVYIKQKMGFDYLVLQR
jgi:hypothetical protein